MSAATIITNATAGAPVLNGTEGSLSALFRYLAPILGWSIEFDNGPIIVVKPQSYKGGQALFYRIDDRAARGGAAPRVAEVRAYESMSDINTGAGLIGPAYIHKSNYATTAAKVYIIAGDCYGLHINTVILMASGASESLACLQYLGFLNPLAPNDTPICALFGNPTDGGSTGTNILFQSPATTASRPGMYLHKDRSWTINKAVCSRSSGNCDLDSLAMGSLYKSASWGDTKPLPSAATIGGDIGATIYINDGAAFSSRAILPGLSRQTAGLPGTLLSSYTNGVTAYNYGGLVIATDAEFRL